MLQRREFLKAAGLGTLVSGMPGLSIAAADTDARFVLVILRGAVDGLALAAPYGDGNYRSLRRELALDDPGRAHGSLNLDGFFGLHPSLTGLHGFFERGDALIVHAVASPYRQRSHFDGQDVLETGGADVGLISSGWLNRAIAPLGATLGSEIAIALAQNTPLVLRGDNSVTSWAPSRLPATGENTIARLQDLYSDDEFFAVRLAQALNAQAVGGDMHAVSSARRGSDASLLKAMMQSTARFLTVDNGPRIAVLEAGGWDTHANQGAATGTLATRFAALDAALVALHAGLGTAWRKTAVAIVTEFGRTARVNGTRGTDHGTASAAVLVGGAVNGGRVLADWPGLGSGELFEDRDLRPTTDLRGLFKGILVDHLSLPSGLIERDVFPSSHAAPRLRDLIRR